MIVPLSLEVLYNIELESVKSNGFLLDRPNLSLYIAVSKTSGIGEIRTGININYKKRSGT